MLRAARRAVILLAICLLGVPASNQTITRSDVISEVGAGRMAWASSQPAGWAGSKQVVNRSDFVGCCRTNGNCPGATVQALTYSQYIACSVTSTTYTPILANNTFAGGSFSSWTSANTGGCSGSLFTAQAIPDEDGDSGLATASSLSCTSTAAVVGLSASFTTTGPPTSQTYSFWYLEKQAVAGDVNCTVGYGAATLSLVINNTTVLSIPNPIADGAWHQVSGGTAAMVNGANTFTINATLQGASGTYPKGLNCTGSSRSAQTMQIDNVVLSGVY